MQTLKIKKPLHKVAAGQNRYVILDTVRGVTLLSMILYHAAWDAVHFLGVNWSWYDGLPGFVWQQSICWTFILLSGFCWSLGRRHARRGALVLAASFAVTAVTVVFTPDARIVFGVLTLLGSCMLLFIPLRTVLERIPALPGIIGAMALFALCRNISQGYIGLGVLRLDLPGSLYQGMLSAYFGFPPEAFFSTDYFPLLPWGFLFAAGFFLYRLCQPQDVLSQLPKWAVPGVTWLGRHSLLVYLAHQPALYVLVMAVRSGF